MRLEPRQTLGRLALALLLALAGCQPVPHPFADSAVLPGGPPLKPPDSAGIIVLPVQNAPAPTAAALASALAAALRDSDVLASTDSQNRSSYRLVAAASALPVRASRLAVAVDWQLHDAEGRIVGRGSAHRDGTVAQWQYGDPGLASALAHAAAPVIARMVAGDAPQPVRVAAAVRIRGVSGAPGDGSTSLARAMAAALGRAGITVADGGGNTPFTLSCRVEAAPTPDGKQRVRIRWLVATAAGGSVGQVAQENTLPRGSLDGAWGDIAYAVAGAAAPSIARLIRHADMAASGG